MKRTILLITFLIYFFSVFAEAGVFSSFSSEKSSSHSIQKIENSIKAADNSSNGSLKHSDFGGHCEESTCHVGHCHHVSTAALELRSLLMSLSNKFSRKPDLAYAQNYSNKLKRPPRLS